MRLFFALWPDEEVRAALARCAGMLRERCGGRMMHPHNIHLTLAFLGDVPQQRLPELHMLAAAIAAPSFVFTVDTQHYWRANRIVWAGTVASPPPLGELAADLARALRAAGFRSEAREYVPHITLLRDALRPPDAWRAGAILWRASEFALVRSVHRDRTLRYETIGRWPLNAQEGTRG